jgi:hypothetical protein
LARCSWQASSRDWRGARRNRNLPETSSGRIWV